MSRMAATIQAGAPMIDIARATPVEIDGDCTGITSRKIETMTSSDPITRHRRELAWAVLLAFGCKRSSLIKVLGIFRLHSEKTALVVQED